MRYLRAKKLIGTGVMLTKTNHGKVQIKASRDSRTFNATLNVIIHEYFNRPSIDALIRKLMFLLEGKKMETEDATDGVFFYCKECNKTHLKEEFCKPCNKCREHCWDLTHQYVPGSRGG